MKTGAALTDHPCLLEAAFLQSYKRKNDATTIFFMLNKHDVVNHFPQRGRNRIFARHRTIDDDQIIRLGLAAFQKLQQVVMSSR